MDPATMTHEDTRVFHRDVTNVPVRVERAEGVHIWDEAGNRLLDASSGLNVVVNIGYGVQEVLDAMQKQAALVTFCGGFTSAPQEELARVLANMAPGDLNHVRFTSGGAEATETAIKLARHYFVEIGQPSKWKIISRWKSFHGNTLGALAASGYTARRLEYTPYLSNFPHISPAYDLAAAEELEAAILNEGPDEIAAFIAEPVVGSADLARIPPEGYFKRVREICDKYDVLFIADEVLCGIGRTGKNFAIDHWNVTPDMIIFGKGVSSGYTPLGGVITTDGIYDAVSEGSGLFDHGYTYSGNPLSCAVGLAVLNYLNEHQLVERSAETGQYLLNSLRRALAESPIVGEISGLGMLTGIELVSDKSTRTPFAAAKRIGARIGKATRDRGVLINPGFGAPSLPTDPERIGVCPSFIFTREHVDEAVAALSAAIMQIAQEEGLA
ncbi:aspartate aminotransferase family protein [Arthrobacter sp. StoSoilB5]|uniref:aminotransferase family protein n=1 Tax=Arthrobacter sp. StoSoilB5 TaxID=2830992 RepID=UPI001CC54028|nr:aspartate aminotransferase family protein [Arthrobacter sp. StoSoilB5]BCW45485.1 aspartate aminotransferase family protein [Arthrobacter sp. StoSoilB5]